MKKQYLQPFIENVTIVGAMTMTHESGAGRTDPGSGSDNVQTDPAPKRRVF